MTTYSVLMSTLVFYMFKSNKKTLPDSLDYEKVETKKLKEDKEALLKKLQEANSLIQNLQGRINGMFWT